MPGRGKRRGSEASRRRERERFEKDMAKDRRRGRSERVGENGGGWSRSGTGCLMVAIDAKAQALPRSSDARPNSL